MQPATPPVDPKEPQEEAELNLLWKKGKHGVLSGERVVYLIHDVGDRLDQFAVLLSHKAVPPLLLLQGLLVARPEEPQVVTAAVLWARRSLSQKRTRVAV